jgi:DNA-binding helix-hairpin-helix protein with protein kinase domain
MILRRASDGTRIRLGRQLGRGGEGTVHEVPGEARVAKIYHKAPAPAKVEKLRAMTRGATPALLRTAAWPVELLEDEARRVRGFLMPRVAARENAHVLYSPKSRRQSFPHADFRFVVRAAANVARAFASLHAEGHVIGDVNHGNALIGHDATVVLIDCDSFQVRDPAGRVFTCDVGVPLFTAPELQNQGFRGLKRAVRHDCFGLAVLLFHLLFQGRHPFAGICAEGEMSIERAIAESRFAYGAERAQRGMTPPPGTLALDTFGARVALLFENAFAPPGESWRPQAVEWVEALVALERDLEPCVASQAHFHPRGECCWCAVERLSGVRLYGPASLLESLAGGVLESLWRPIKAVPAPPAEPSFPAPPQALRGVPGPGGEQGPSRIYNFAVLGATIGISLAFPEQAAWWWKAGFIVLVAPYAVAFWKFWRWERRRLRNALLDQKQRDALWYWNQVMARWRAECSNARFNELVEKLKGARVELGSWESVRRREMRDLRRDLSNRAREFYLDKVRLDAANLPLRREDLAALASFGIETVADVMRAPARLLHLLPAAAAHDAINWANTLSRDFRFDSKAPLDPELLAHVEKRLADRQQELLGTLRNGPRELEKLREEILESRRRMQPAIDAAWKELRAAREAAGQ